MVRKFRLVLLAAALLAIMGIINFLTEESRKAQPPRVISQTRGTPGAAYGLTTFETTKDGKTLIAGSDASGPNIFVWNIGKSEVPRILQGPAPYTLGDSGSFTAAQFGIQTLQISPDGTLLAAAAKTIRVLDMESGKVLWDQPLPDPQYTRTLGWTRSNILVSSCGETVDGRKNVTTLRDGRTGKLKGTINSTFRHIQPFDKDTFLGSTSTGIVGVWRGTQKVKTFFDPQYGPEDILTYSDAIALSGDRERLACIGMFRDRTTKNTIEVWDLNTSEKRVVRQIEAYSVAAFSPNLERAAIVKDTTVTLIDLQSGRDIRRWQLEDMAKDALFLTDTRLLTVDASDRITTCDLTQR